MYAYAANNPVHYMDPDGKSVFIDCTEDEDGKRTLKEINKYSYSQYQIDENGYLYKTDKINKKGSKLYSEAIDRCIEDENSEVTIRYIKTPYAVLYKNLIDVKSFGGATTFFNANESDPSEVYIFFMNKGLSDKFKWNINAARILMHEIVGHADPIIAGGPRDNENAIENENAVLDQLNRPNQKREVKQWHTAR